MSRGEGRSVFLLRRQSWFVLPCTSTRMLPHGTANYTPHTCSHYHVLKDSLSPVATANTRNRALTHTHTHLCDDAHGREASLII